MCVLEGERERERARERERVMLCIWIATRLGLHLELLKNCGRN